MFTYTNEQLEWMEKNLPFRSVEQYERDERKKEIKKEIDKLEARLARLIDKRVKMLFCAGVTDATGKRIADEDAKTDRARQRLLRTKSWKGNEYEIETTKSSLKHLREELTE